MINIEKIIYKAICDTEFENITYITGGYVRDQIIGNRSSDIDIVVEMNEGGKKLAEFLYQKGISSRPVIFNRFGTAQVTINDNKIEFVMTRKESYKSRDRKPKVQPATISEDVFRRDFTINSLLKNISSSEVIDISKRGKKDIKNKIIRATSNPTVIFEEDPLRMLRAIRFAVQLNFKIEAKTKQGIIENSESLVNISKERIRDEFIKILLFKNAVQGINMLIDYGLMEFIIPELLELNNLKQNKYHDKSALKHTLQVLENVPQDLDLRFAALLHDIGKPLVKMQDKKGIHFYKHEIESEKLARKILNRLKFSKNEINKVCFLVRNHMKFKQFEDNLNNLKDKTIRKFLLEMGENFEDLLLLVHADNLSHAKKFVLKEQMPNLKKRVELIKKNQKEFQLPIKGEDIMLYLKIKEGKKIGMLLNEAKNIWLNDPSIEKYEILEMLKNEKH
jgi:tRNA nucleotidyltransferase/poly(A) polymerase